MKKQQDDLRLDRFQVRTDLAFEAHEWAKEKYGERIPGIQKDVAEADGVAVTKMHVLDRQGAEIIGKLPGKYLTFEIPELRTKDTTTQQRVMARFSEEFHAFLDELQVPPNAKVLVVGLGNWNVTPDALGPMVAENMLVTRHLFELMPEQVDQGYRQVSVLSPGVLGITGIETSEIVFSVVEQIKPDFLIAVDALASKAVERVNTTIQVSNTGIHPGSGVGNKRKALTEETLGIPVLAIGVPTVVDAVTIANDTIDYVLAYMGRQMEEEKHGTKQPAQRLVPEGIHLPFYEPVRYTPEDMPGEETRKTLLGLVGGLNEQEKRQLIQEVLTPMGHNLMVTPKEVDTFVEDISNILSNGLNIALHEAVTADNVASYTH